MKTTIAEIKKLPVGTELRGFPLTLKTARAAFVDNDQKVWQEVVFMDSTGEMLGHILLPTKKEHDPRTGGYTPWQSKTNICILEATVQETEHRNRQDVKLVVFDCFDTTPAISWEQRDELTADDWKRLRDEEIAGKIRHGLTIAWVGAAKRLIITPAERDLIKDLVEFVKHG